MKKVYHLLIFIFCLLLCFPVNSFSKDKNKDPQLPQVKSAKGNVKFHRITYSNIIDPVGFAYNYAELRDKSVKVEDTIPTFKTEYEYVDNDILSTSFEYKNEAWVPDSRGDFYFSFSETMTDSSIYHDFDTITQNWQLGTKWISTFDGAQNRTKRTMYDFNKESSTWKNSIQQSYTYLNNGDTIIEEQFYWPENDTNWTQSMKFETTFVNDLRKTYTIYNWDLASKDWVTQSKEEYFHDASDNVIKSVSSFWDQANAKFVEVMKLIYAGDNLEFITYFSWNDNSQTWKPSGMMIFNIDQNGRTTSTDQLQYNEGTDDFSRTSITEFMYKDQAVGIDNIRTLNVEIYPNPTKGLLYLKNDILTNCKVEILDISGKTLLTKTYKNNLASISLNNFKSGMYFVKVTSGNQATIKQIIKQ